MLSSVSVERTCSSVAESTATPSVREICTASSSPNQFGRATIVAAMTIPKTSRFFQSG
jgi:hypothetical protein